MTLETPYTKSNEIELFEDRHLKIVIYRDTLSARVSQKSGYQRAVHALPPSAPLDTICVRARRLHVGCTQPTRYRIQHFT